MKSVQKTKYNFATDLVINRRTERLKHQFEYNLNYKVDLTNLKHPRNSFDRIFWFIYEYTDISNIESIKTRYATRIPKISSFRKIQMYKFLSGS